MDNKSNIFTKVDNDILFSKDLNDTDKALYIIIAATCKKKDGSTYFKIQTMADRLGISRTMANLIILKLQKQKHLIINHKCKNDNSGHMASSDYIVFLPNKNYTICDIHLHELIVTKKINAATLIMYLQIKNLSEKYSNTYICKVVNLCKKLDIHKNKFYKCIKILQENELLTFTDFENNNDIKITRKIIKLNY